MGFRAWGIPAGAGRRVRHRAGPARGTAPASGQRQAREIDLQKLRVATPVAGAVKHCVDVVEDVFGRQAARQPVHGRRRPGRARGLSCCAELRMKIVAATVCRRPWAGRSGRGGIAERRTCALVVHVEVTVESTRLLVTRPRRSSRTSHNSSSEERNIRPQASAA